MAILESDLLGTLERTVDPVLLPVTLDEIKDELDILDDETVNDKLTRLAKRVVRRIELDTRLAMMTQTWKLWMDYFPGGCGEFELRKGPVASLTHIKYYTGGVLTLLAGSAYQTDLSSKPARVRPATGGAWPWSDAGRIKAVEVQFVAGYVSLATVPEEIKDVVLQAIKMAWLGCGFSENYWILVRRLRQWGYV